jgi:hypothetical protein
VSQALLNDDSARRRATCHVCGQAKAWHLFKDSAELRRTKTGVCITCLGKNKSAKQLADRQRKLREKLKGLTQVGGVKRQGANLTEFVDDLVGEFGGMKGIVKSWRDQLLIAESENPGSQKVLNTYHALARIITEAEKHREQMSAAEALSDEELLTEMMLMMQEMGFVIAEDVIEGEIVEPRLPDPSWADDIAQDEALEDEPA